MNQNRLDTMARATATLILAAALLGGCGGSGEDGQQHPLRGTYRGETLQGETGRIAFRVDNAGALTGRCSLPPICKQRFQITGTVDQDGAVTFEGRSRGITFAGTGHLDGWSGNGSWAGGDGSEGGWWVTYDIDIGPIL